MTKLKVSRSLAISVSLLMLMSCAAHKRNTAWSAHNTYLKMIEQQLAPDAGDLDCKQPKNWLAQYECEVRAADMSKDQAKIAQRRNEILDKFVQLADSDYIRFEGQFNGYHSAVATLGDFASLALTGAGSVFDAAKELSAAATGVQGAQKSYEKNFYDSQTRFVITLKMEALRSDALTKIKSGELLPAICPEPRVEQTKAQCYTLEQGMNDVENYFSAGTIHRALAEINKNSATESKAAEQKLNDLKNMTPLNSPQK